MKFHEFRDSSDRLTVAVDDMPSLAYRFVRWKLCREFGLKKCSEYTKGLNEKYQVFMGLDGMVSIDWDTWSGFTVTALNSESEILVKKVGNWLNRIYCKKTEPRTTGAGLDK